MGRINYKHALLIGATSLMPFASVALPATAQAQSNNPLVEASMKAFDAWSKKTIEASPIFNVNGVQPGTKVDWVAPVTNDTNFIATLANNNDNFRKQTESPQKINDVKLPVSEPTPAVTADGVSVVVLPYKSAKAEVNGIQLDKMSTGALIPINDGNNSADIPFAAGPQTIRLLYSLNGGKTTSGYDFGRGATQAMTIQDPLSRIADAAPTVSPLNPVTATSVTPGQPVTIDSTTKAINDTAGAVRSVMTAMAVTNDAKLDAADGQKDGLTPLKDANGQVAESDVNVNGGGVQDVKHSLSFVAPQDGSTIYIALRTLDADGNDISPVNMTTIKSEKPMIDVQASSLDGTNKLRDGSQMIFNQVKASQLTPGRPYQVLVNLYQCDAPNECHEIAAVNREIIPQTPTSVQNFSVTVDADKLKNENSTFEWTTALYEGTGDVKNMGPMLASVLDHPGSEVLSKSGDQKPLGSEKVNVKQADEVVVAQNNSQQPSVNESVSESESLRIGNEAPPYNMETVRERNVAPENEGSSLNKQVMATLGAAAVMLVSFFLIKRASDRTDAQKKPKKSDQA